MDFITFFNNLEEEHKKNIIEKLNWYDRRHKYKVEFTSKEYVIYEAFTSDWNYRCEEYDEDIKASWKDEINVDELYKLIKEDDGAISLRAITVFCLNTENADFKLPVREFFTKYNDFFESHQDYLTTRLLDQGLMDKKTTVKKKVYRSFDSKIVWKE